MMNKDQMMNIPAEKFQFVQEEKKIYDTKLETKSIGYMKDAMIRFCKNKSAVVAFGLIVFLMLYSIVIPWFSDFDVTFRDGYYKTVLPKVPLFTGTGFMDGTTVQNESEAGYQYLNAIGQETGRSAVTKVINEYFDSTGAKQYRLRVDTYERVGFVFANLSETEYKALMAYQDETGIQIIYPMPQTHNTPFVVANSGANYWYKLQNEAYTSSGAAVLDKDGNYIPNYMTSNDPQKTGYTSLRIEGDNGGADGNTWYTYAVKNQTGYKVRVHYYEYFQYKNGFKPVFYFGTNIYGQDIFACLAYAGRLSFLLAFSVSLINFLIGACYGAIEGYYGGTADIIMQRISEILGSVPFVVAATLFQLHLAEKAGVLGCLLFAFVLTGWIGMSNRVRMQFYRFKGHEYVLAARTLGARDGRLIFKHIFPNSLGTIITGSVLAIPGVIFSESMLSYLGIINLEASSMTSIGTMLSNGQGYLGTFPHIILFPALFISILEISFNLFGNGLRDAFNPSLRGADE